EGGGGGEDVAVACGGPGDLRGQHGGQGVRVLGACGGQHLADALDLRGFGGHGVRVVGQYQHVDGFRLDRGGGADGTRGGDVEFTVQVFGDDENLAHENLPFLNPSPVGRGVGVRVR